MTPRPLVGLAALGRLPDPTIGLGMGVKPPRPAPERSAQQERRRCSHCGRMLAGIVSMPVAPEGYVGFAVVVCSTPAPS